MHAAHQLLLLLMVLYKAMDVTVRSQELSLQEMVAAILQPYPVQQDGKLYFHTNLSVNGQPVVGTHGN